MQSGEVVVRDLTMNRALLIQAQDIDRWATILQPDVVLTVREIAIKYNEQGYKSPYDVWRGDMINSFIHQMSYDRYRK